MNLDSHRLKTLDEVRAFIAGSSPFQFTLTNWEEAYTWLQATLLQFRYATLRRFGDIHGIERRFGDIHGIE